MYQYNATESPYIYVMWKLVGQPTTLDFSPWRYTLKSKKSDSPGFWIKIKMSLESSKSPKNEVFRVLAKILSAGIYMIFCFYTKVSFNGILTFCKTSMSGKNLVFNLKANQNAEFFKLEYLTNNLRYEFEFLNVTRGP